MRNTFLKVKTTTILLCSLLMVIIISRFFVFSTNSENDTNAIVELKPIGQQPYIPSNLVFANEVVPVQHNDVKESLDRELLSNAYWHSQTILLLKRAHRYFPVIEPILKSYGIPGDFKYIPLIESGFLNIGSPAGARGYWQLIDGTAKENGLEVNDDVDERNHIEKSTIAACKFFLQAYEKFHSWPMAAASYNMGVTGLNNQVKNQGTDNFYDLWLNTETGRYVFRVIAIKLIFESPKLYGIILKERDLYKPIPTKSIVVDTSILSLFDFAKSQGLSYKAFKTYNPWLVSTKLPNKTGKKYTIAIPEKGFRDITFDSNE